VKLDSDTCTTAPKRSYVGTLTNQGVPWGRYDICADGITSGSTRRRVTITNVNVQNYTNVTTAPTFYLTGSSSSSGSCPS
jgi:hypothetical protein